MCDVLCVHAFFEKQKCPCLVEVGHWSEVDIFEEKTENPTAGLTAWAVLDTACTGGAERSHDSLAAAALSSL